MKYPKILLTGGQVSWGKAEEYLKILVKSGPQRDMNLISQTRITAC